jgi:RNA polymerase primary sigma factor
VPPLPHIRTPALASLERQLRLVSRDALLRDVERIEALAPDVDPAREYPEDWVVFRVTGFRPDLARASLIPGRALREDLCALCERLCAHARLRAIELAPERFLSATELRARWRVSDSTLKRLRRAGLVTRRVLAQSLSPAQGGVAPSPTAGVWAARSVVEWFERDCAAELPGAARPPRRDPREHERAVREALRYRRALGWSLHRCAERLAERHGRSVQGVRELLLRDGRTARAFPARPRVDDRRRLAMLRLWRAGVEPARLASLAGKSTPLARRDVNLARLAVLRDALGLRERDAGALPSASAPAPQIAHPHLAHPHHDRSDLALATRPASVRTGLATPWATDVAALARDWRARVPAANVEERERAGAFQALVHEARSLTERQDALDPSAQALDHAETMLRWASLLCRELVRSQHRLILDTVELRAGCRLEELPPRVITRVLRAAVLAVARSVEHFGPLSPGRLAGAAALHVDKAIAGALHDAGWKGGGGTRRAGVGAGVAIEDLSRALCPWQRWLDPDPRVVARARAVAITSTDATRNAAAHELPALSDRARRILSRRFGLDGDSPWTLAQLREDLGVSPIRVSVLERAAIREALGRQGTGR